MFDDYDENCPCNSCNKDCDAWESRYCCELCQYLNGREEPTYCDDCNPMDI